MWSDNETSIDYVGFTHLVDAVTSIVKNDNLCPVTIGVFGDWGSGKSSLLKMAKTDLGKDSTLLVLSFNGWLFEGYEDAKTALMGTILDQIRSCATLTTKGKRLFFHLADRINWLRTLGSLGRHSLAWVAGGAPALGISIASDAIGSVSEAAKKIAEMGDEVVEKIDLNEFIKKESNCPSEEVRKAIHQFREDFEALLNETKFRRVVVIIDDLDRCLPDTIIETLEAIKLFLFVNKSAFVIGADERLIKYAVRRRFPELPGERVEVGRDYLEKLIQFPIRIPPLGRGEMETYINVLFAQATELATDQLSKIQACTTMCDAQSLLEVRFNHGIATKMFGTLPPKLDENLQLAQRLAPVLATGLDGNPRQCKRFLSTFMIRCRMAASRNIVLKSAILAKLMLLEHFRAETFRSLGELQAVQQGCPKQLQYLERAINPAEHKSPVGTSSQSKKISGKAAESSSDVHKAADTDTKAGMEMEEDLFVQTCQSDVWIKDWLLMDPPLGKEDIRPYYYFSRDKLGMLGLTAQRISPVAQQILAELFSESDSARLRAFKKASGLNTDDATAVFGALTERSRVEEDTGGENSALRHLFEWGRQRIELFPQLIAFLNDFPDTRIPASFAMTLCRLTGNDSERVKLARRLLQKWQQSTINTQLAKAATSALNNKHL